MVNPFKAQTSEGSKRTAGWPSGKGSTLHPSKLRLLHMEAPQGRDVAAPHAVGQHDGASRRPLKELGAKVQRPPRKLGSFFFFFLKGLVVQCFFFFLNRFLK